MGGEKGRRGHISEADVTGEAWVGLESAQWDPRWVLSASEWDWGSSSKAALDCWGRALGPAAVHPPLCSPAAGPPGPGPSSAPGEAIRQRPHCPACAEGRKANSVSSEGCSCESVCVHASVCT